MKNITHIATGNQLKVDAETAAAAISKGDYEPTADYNARIEAAAAATETEQPSEPAKTETAETAVKTETGKKTK